MSDNTTTHLTPVQEQVIAAIASGATINAAAQAASIHRNTIAYWRRTSLRFRETLAHAQYDKAVFIREEAESYVADAFAAVHAILTNPNASDTARLNAAKFIIEKASTPPPPEAGVVYRFESIAMSVGTQGKEEIVPSPAQASESPQAQHVPEIVNSPAQSPAHKVGRNELCPCGSGVKFKRCCLGKPQFAAA